MDHNDIRHKLSDYIDNALSDRERREVEEHVKTCSACSNALEELRKTIGHVRTIGEVEPPAWMTQKIMSTVREDAERKRSVFRRFFYPLSVKIPIQAVAVLFLAVAAFSIYRSNLPSETPVTPYSERKESPAIQAPARPAITPRPAAPAKKVPQAPEYKSLDMKYEYEKPAPPAAPERAADSAKVPAAKEELSRSASGNAAEADRFAAPEPAAPSAAGRRLQAAVREKPAKAGAAETAAAVPSVAVAVSDLGTADRKLSDAIRPLGGSIIRSVAGPASRTIRLELQSRRIPDLVKLLQDIGSIKQNSLPSSSNDEYVRIDVVIEQSSHSR